MKIAISNIIWKKGKKHLPSFFSTLSNQGVEGIELALNCLWQEPTKISKDDLKWLKTMISDYKLKLISLHSITYSRPDLEIFLDYTKRKDFIEYLKKYCDLARELDCQNIVLGSPKSRITYGRNREELDKIFLDFLHKVDNYSDGIFFNIESLSKEYCEYLNTHMEIVELIKNAEFKNIFLQLDVRSVIEAKENIDNIFQNSGYIKHVHVGNPGIKIPAQPFIKIHKSVSKELKNIGYDGYITAEVLNHNDEIMHKYLDKTVKIMRELYV